MHGPVRAPATAGVGTAKVTVALDAWKEGKVTPTNHEVPVVAPKNRALKLEPISPRLKRELVHPNRSGTLAGLRFAPDGKRFLAGDSSEGIVAVWDVATGKRLRTIATGARGGCNYLVTPDWRMLFVPLRGPRKYERVEKGDKGLVRWTFDGCVRAWDLDTGRPRRTYRHDPPRHVLGMELSPDGGRFLTFDWLPGTYEARPKRAVSVWDVATGKYRDLSGELNFSAEFSPDGRSLATTAAGEGIYARAVKVFDPATGREKLLIPVRARRPT